MNEMDKSCLLLLLLLSVKCLETTFFNVFTKVMALHVHMIEYGEKNRPLCANVLFNISD